MGNNPAAIRNNQIFDVICKESAPKGRGFEIIPP
jgi:hypothetical protein